MIDTTSIKIDKIIRISLVAGIVGASLDIISFYSSLSLSWGVADQTTWQELWAMLHFFGFPFSPINIIAGLVSFLWVKDNLVRKIISGIITSILVIPLGMIVGWLFYFIFNAILSLLSQFR